MDFIGRHVVITHLRKPSQVVHAERPKASLKPGTCTSRSASGSAPSRLKIRALTG
jgi:hypothetical protein